MKAPFKTFGDDAQPPPSISEDWTDMSTAHPGLASATDSNANLPVVCPISLTARQARIAATAVDAEGTDAEILRRAAPFSIGLLLALCALVLAASQGWLGALVPAP